MSAGNASKSMCLTISARRSVNSGRAIICDSAFAMAWNCGDDGLVAKLGSTPRSTSRSAWMLDVSKRDLLRRLRAEVVPEGDDAVFGRRAVALRPLEQAVPGDRRGERAPRGSAEADDLEALLNAALEQRLQRARDERALASPTLTRDCDPSSAHGCDRMCGRLGRRQPRALPDRVSPRDSRALQDGRRVAGRGVRVAGRRVQEGEGIAGAREPEARAARCARRRI